MPAEQHVFGDPRIPANFWAKAYPQENGCWLWSGRDNGRGYGKFSFKAKTYYCHRFAYMALIGPITSETLDHLCDTPSCVNPDHLKPATQRENILRSNCPTAKNARKMACPLGHPYSGANLYLYTHKSGRLGRHCRICDARRTAETNRKRAMNPVPRIRRRATV